MKNKKIVIILGIIIFLLVILLTILATLYFSKNNNSDKLNNLEINNSSEINKLKEALLKEGYEEKETDIYVNNYMPSAYYKYNFKTKEFIYGHETDYAPNNPAIASHISVTRTYKLKMDIATNNVVETGINSSLVKDVYTDQYNFQTGTGECKNNCSYLIDFKSDFLELLDKYDIDIEKIK